MNDQLETLEHAKRTVIDLAIQFGPKVVVAVAIIVAGVFVGRWAAGIRAARASASQCHISNLPPGCHHWSASSSY